MLGIAFNSFARILNLRSMYLFIAVAIAMVVGSPKNSHLLANFLPILMVMLMGCREIAFEIQTKLLDTILAKPVSRAQFLAGKYLGVTGVGAVMCIVLGGIAMAVGESPATTHAQLQGIFLSIMACFAFAGVSIFLSVMTVELTAMIFAVIVMVIGALTYLLPFMIETAESTIGPLVYILWGIYYIFPNLKHFAMSTVGDAYPVMEMLWVMVYGMSYGGVLVALTSLMFRNRDIN